MLEKGRWCKIKERAARHESCRNSARSVFNDTKPTVLLLSVPAIRQPTGRNNPTSVCRDIPTHGDTVALEGGVVSSPTYDTGYTITPHLTPSNRPQLSGKMLWSRFDQ